MGTELMTSMDEMNAAAHAAVSLLKYSKWL